MANEKRGEVKVDIGDGTKKIRYTMNALIDFEDVTGKSVTEVGNNPGMREIRALLWAGLRGAGSKWRIEDVGKHMHVDKIAYYGEACGRALSLALGSDADEDEDEGNDPLDPTDDPADAS